jgi:predicted SnoaL-like aldol condensation-catalyzing enzyme
VPNIKKYMAEEFVVQSGGDDSIQRLMGKNIVPGRVAKRDLFRVENGKIAEHWDVYSPVPPPELRKNRNDPF